MDVLVTVGMGRWPFDRLIGALEPLTAQHRVFAQTGTSTAEVTCEHAAFVPYPQLRQRIETADVVITHAGNTVRLAQRAGRIPVAIAREAARGEMGNDHQVAFLRAEERAGRVVAVWDVARLGDAVDTAAQLQAQLHAQPQAQPPSGPGGLAGLAPPADPGIVADHLDDLWHRLSRNPFARHPLRRYTYAWDELAGLDGPHLDAGIGDAVFASTLAQTCPRPCHGVDVHAGYVAAAAAAHPGLQLKHVSAIGELPYPEGMFTSVSLLDVLEHCADEDRLLTQVHRVLSPGGTLVVTVPARHAFSILDPDNAKFRAPRLHRAVYTRRFGAQVYHERFVDTSNGLIGDIAAERGEHTNYRRDELVATLARNGFEVIRESGSGLFWRLLHGPALLAGPRARAGLERLIRIDGQAFRSANLFLTLRRTPEPAHAHPGDRESAADPSLAVAPVSMSRRWSRHDSD